MHKKRAVAAAATTAIALLGAGVGAAVAEPTPLTGAGTARMYGIDRFATAVDVSKKSFTTPQDLFDSTETASTALQTADQKHLSGCL